MMSQSKYQPVACALHSELELAIMRHVRLLLETDTGELAGLPLDIQIRGGAEYLLLQDDRGQSHWLRLDRLSLMTPI